MKKRRHIDFKALATLTGDDAVAMPEAAQRLAAAPQPHRENVEVVPVKKSSAKPVEILVDLNFKVPDVFRKRFRLRAAEEDINYVELLYRAFEAWEAKHRGKR